MKRPLHSIISIPIIDLNQDSYAPLNKASNQPFIASSQVDPIFDVEGFGFSSNNEHDHFELNFDIINEEIPPLNSTSTSKIPTTITPTLSNHPTNYNDNNNNNTTTTVTPIPTNITPTPTAITPTDILGDDDDIFGDNSADSSSSGEEEVLEEGTF